MANDPKVVVEDLRNLLATSRCDSPNSQAVVEARHLCRCLWIAADNDPRFSQALYALQERAEDLLYRPHLRTETPALRRAIDELLRMVEARLGVPEPTAAA